MQTVGHSKVMLEKELQEVIALTSQELEEYREKVLELEDEVGELMITWQSGQATPLPVQLWNREMGHQSLACVPDLSALPSAHYSVLLWICDHPGAGLHPCT